MSHIEKEKLEALYQRTLSSKEQMELLTHMSTCEHCTSLFASIVESKNLLHAPDNLKASIIAESQCLPVQMSIHTKKTTKQLQLLFYSLKVSTAVVCSILMLGLINLGLLNPNTDSLLALGNTHHLKIGAISDQSNKLAEAINDFTTNLINWEVTND
ncbi:MAG: hypothetical protein RSD03_06905 [Lachnospiraceae bacterium]